MATRTAAKESRVKKSTAKKSPARKSTADKSTPEATPKKAAAKKSTTSSPKKTAGKRGTDNYTNPDLREKVKQEVLAGDKGGRPGQWSARKAQLVAREYEAQGGDYKHPRDPAQESLKHWGDEHWHTEDGKKAVEPEVTHRYLPDAAWKELSPEERKATDRKKVEGSKSGAQFIPNTKAASKARKRATKKD